MQDTLKQLFRSWLQVTKNEAVVLFMVGLMENPKPLVNHIYDIFVDTELARLRSSLWDEEAEKLEMELETLGKNPQDLTLFKSLFFESTVSMSMDVYHNQFVNIYQHMNDDENDRPRDIKDVQVPSRLYLFSFIQESINGISLNPRSNEEIPECAVVILQPLPYVTKSLFALCHQISECQSVTDLYMLNVISNDLTASETPIFSRQAKSLWLWECKLPPPFVRDILRQLSSCVTLQMLWLRDINLSSVEEDLGNLLQNLVSHHERLADATHHQERLELVLDRNSLSYEFKKKWRLSCKRISSIKYQIW